VEEPASHRRVTPMVLNCGGFFVYLQDMIEAAHPIQNNEIKYCVMCLSLHGEWTPSSCDVYWATNPWIGATIFPAAAIAA
jgi:hypothetical protein